MLDSIGKNINDYHLINDTINLSDEDKFMKENNEELNIVVYEQDISTISKLNKDQKFAYDFYQKKYFQINKQVFFIDGPGGTGKTYLYYAILASIKSKNLIALADRTAH